MNPIPLVETLVNLCLEAIEMNIATLHHLGHHRDRAEIINNLKRMVGYLHEVVNNTKEKLFEDIEKHVDLIMGVSENLMNDINDMRHTVDGDSHLEELTQKLATEHGKLTKRLGVLENKTSQEVSLRFKALNDRIESVLSTLDGLRH